MTEISVVLILATRNRDKVRELSSLFAELPLARIVAAEDWGEIGDVVEDGESLQENALKKAREVSRVTGELCLADDTGLEVDALDGAPGLLAARFAGPGASYADNRRKLLDELRGVEPPHRSARFRTVMALVDPRPQAEGGWGEHCVEGTLEGEILQEERGDRGFGYDPVFYVPSKGETLAEMELAEKNRISHRAVASQRMLALLRQLMVGV